MTTTIAELPTDKWTEIPITESSVIESVFALRGQNLVQFALDHEAHYIYALTEDNFVILMNYLLAGGSPGEGFNWAKGLDLGKAPEVINVDANLDDQSITIETPGSSVLASIGYGPDEDGKVLFTFTTNTGIDYEYTLTTDEADSLVGDLVTGSSPGQIWNQVRKGWYPIVSEPEEVAPEPAPTGAITVVGPEADLELLTRHLYAQGFTVMMGPFQA